VRYEKKHGRLAPKRMALKSSSGFGPFIKTAFGKDSIYQNNQFGPICANLNYFIFGQFYEIYVISPDLGAFYH
jgi:hypothetical protein